MIWLQRAAAGSSSSSGSYGTASASSVLMNATVTRASVALHIWVVVVQKIPVSLPLALTIS